MSITVTNERLPNPFLTHVPNAARLRARDEVRTLIMQASGVDVSTRAAIASNDNPSQLVDQFTHETLSAIEQASLRAATLPQQPWAGHYDTTLMAAGLLGCRYQDLNQAAQGEWAKQRDYIRHHPAEVKALASLLWAKAAPRVRFIGGRCNLEPPYTYDPETRRVATLFNPYIAEDVARWLGDAEPDPEYLDEPAPGMVSVSLGWDGWDEATGEPKPEGGRLVASECFDTNPGAWHLAVVNQLGVSQRSMIMDASFSNEVWNQPLYAYRYTYFNPHTLVQNDSLAAATVSRGISPAIFSVVTVAAMRSPWWALSCG